MTTRRRIVLATRIFTPEPAAASFRLQALADALVAAGHDVTVLTTGAPSGAGTDGCAAGAANKASSPHRALRVRRWPVLRDKHGYVRGYLQYLSFDVPLAVRLLATPADVVVAEPPPTTGAVVRVLAALKRVPYVYYAADVWSDAAALTGAPGPIVAALRGLERWVLRGAAGVITVSDDVAARLAELGAPRATVVRNGVDTAVFAPDGPTGERGYFLYAGTASEWQGAEVFIRALAKVRRQHPRARLVYIGQGSTWEQLQALAVRLAPGAVDFHPTMPPERVAPWQRGALAAVVSMVPGAGYDFAYPTKILAALASGTPVIYAGTGPAATDIAEHRLGWAVPYDADAVAAAMEAALVGHRPGVTGGAGTPDRAGAPHEPTRLARWVQERRSLRRTGEQAAEEVLAAARRRWR